MKRSILIVESSRALQYLITTILSEKNVVKSVQNSRHAMQLFASGYEANLLILDIPNMESENFEFMEHVATSSIFENIPIIVLSANHSEELKNTCLQLGATCFLAKPFDPVYLFEKVNQLLSVGEPDIVVPRRRVFNNMNFF
jgi:CheY-like chemotaxis protein